MHLPTIPGGPRNVSGRQGRKDCRILFIAPTSPSDFFLFGYIKEQLTQFNCTNREELKNEITAIFNGVDKDVPFAVFESWVKPVK
jgi:hypothetical protein